MVKRKLKLLVDTNIFLEILLGREKALECKEFFRKAKDNYELFVTIFTVHSIGIILYKYGRIENYEDFLNFLKQYKIKIFIPSIDEEKLIIEAIKKFNLDFDDAFQYVSAKILNVDYIVSFDKDFDRTDIKRKEPKELI